SGRRRQTGFVKRGQQDRRNRRPVGIKDRREPQLGSVVEGDRVAEVREALLFEVPRGEHRHGVGPEVALQRDLAANALRRENEDEERGSERDREQVVARWTELHDPSFVVPASRTSATESRRLLEGRRSVP